MKILEKTGTTRPGIDQRQAGQEHEGERRPDPASRRAGRRIRLGRSPRRWNSGPGSKVSTTPVKAWSSSSSVTTPRPGAGIVQVDPPLAEALQHHEVVEVPVQDHRRRQRAQGLPAPS